MKSLALEHGIGICIVAISVCLEHAMVQLLDNRCFRDPPLPPDFLCPPPPTIQASSSSSFHNSLILNYNNSSLTINIPTGITATLPYSTHTYTHTYVHYFVHCLSIFVFYRVVILDVFRSFTITLFNPSVYLAINLFIDLFCVLNHPLLYPREYPVSHWNLRIFFLFLFFMPFR